jgi:hypothetical protein
MEGGLDNKELNLIRINPVTLPDVSLDRPKGVHTVRCTSA